MNLLQPIGSECVVRNDTIFFYFFLVPSSCSPTFANISLGFWGFIVYIQYPSKHPRSVSMD